MFLKFAQYYKPHRKLFFADMTCAFIVAMFNLVYPMLTRRIINDYVPNQNLRMILVFGASLLIIYLAKAALNFFIQFKGHVMGVRIQVDIRKDAFKHLQKLPFTYFDRTKSGTIMSRIINDTFEIAELAHHGPEDLFLSAITLIGSFILLANINLLLTIVIFAFIPLLVWFAIRKRLKLSRTSMETRVEIGEVNADLENSIAGVRVSKAYESSDHEMEKFKAGSQSYANAAGLRYRAMAEFFTGTGLIMDCLMLIAVVAGGLFTYYEAINVGDFTAYLLFVNLFTDPIKKLINFVEQLQGGMTGFKRVMELMEVTPEKEDPEAIELTEVQGKIVFDNITFRYDEGKSVLRNMSLTIDQGQTVALVGPSGGGKSTLCHLLPRFYDLDEGMITLDGKDITKFTRLSLRKKIGIVQQDTFLFTGTIRDNIAYGDFDALHGDIVKAAKNAEIHDFIESLPDGYDTFIGERGVMLSGGQKQRISIARIFLKNPPILILDEATSALDNTTELAIQSAFDNLSEGRTTLIVAHRLSTIRHADKIVVLADRGIVEQGSHAELLEQKGLYAKLWEAQIRS